MIAIYELRGFLRLFPLFTNQEIYTQFLTAALFIETLGGGGGNKTSIYGLSLNPLKNERRDAFIKQEIYYSIFLFKIKTHI